MDKNMFLKEIRSLLEAPHTCTDDLLNFLFKHKCLYLLSKATNILKHQYYYLTTNQIIQEFRYSYCKNIFLQLKDIKYAIIKGAVLSNSIYGTPFYRISGDIDILISPKDASKVTEILINEGFQQGKIHNEKITASSREERIYHKLYTHQLSSFQKKTDFLLCPFITIDINFDITWGEEKQKIDIDKFLSHVEITSICNVNVKKLSPIYI